MRLQFQIANEKAADRLIAGVISRIRDAEPVWQFVADDVIMPALSGQFATEGKRGGMPWPKYTAAEQKYYVPYKVKMTGTKKPLLDWYGPGRRMVPSFVTKTHPEHIHRVWKSGVEVGSSVPYAAGHNDGTGKGWGDKYIVPKRPITVLTTRTDIAKIVEAANAYIHDGREGLAKVQPINEGIRIVAPLVVKRGRKTITKRIKQFVPRGTAPQKKGGA